MKPSINIPARLPTTRLLGGAIVVIHAIVASTVFAADSPDGDRTMVDFDNQVMPVLTKAGCNTGACHGAAVGRGGFKLSLYGGDPAADFRSIAFQLKGRRVNIAKPAESLFVLKPTGQLEHGGGYRFDEESESARRLLRWIEQGARRKPGKQLQHFEVSPKRKLVEHANEKVQLKALAVFSNKTRSDVTKWTVFTPDDPGSVKIDKETYVAEITRPGRHIVTARYLDRVLAIELITPIRKKQVNVNRLTRTNFIDDHINQLLGTLRLPVSKQVEDEVFLRRITLDLTGRLPSIEQRKAFFAVHREKRREQWIDQLLKSDDFNVYWTMQLAKLFRIRSQPQETQGALAYHRWLKGQLAANTGYDEIARSLIVSTGDTHRVGPANFYRTVAGPREQAELTSELFMANRLRCANCHNHPLDQWTQDDYHGLAAIFAKMSRGRVIKPTTRGSVIHPRTGEPAVPRIPGVKFVSSKTDSREALADWLTSEENPFFAKAIVNRLWKAMMGRGLVEPTDDLRATNPATHPALLNDLASDFIKHGYRLRHSLRTIAMSAAYARSGDALAANSADDRYYSHAIAKRLSPEVLADAISDVIGVHERYGEFRVGTRAIELFDPKTPSMSLDVLGRCSREDSCEANGAGSAGLSTMLHLLNGKLLNQRIVSRDSLLSKRLAQKTKPLDIVNEFYLRALGRNPSKAEQEFWRDQFVASKSGAAKREVLEDFVWSLLTCRAFKTN